jgi:hypothetical protein
MLIGMDNIAIAAKNKIGNFGNKPLAIGAGQK